jgi:hypothetical protein
MVLTIFDLLLLPIFLLIIYFYAGHVQDKNIVDQPLYRWYTKGVMVKMFGAVSVCLIYQFYYEGGDTTNYYETTAAVSELLFKDGTVFLDVILGNNSPENYSYFDMSTGYPVFWKDGTALFVSRLLVPLYFIGFKSFVVMAILLAWICFSGLWKLFLLFNDQFPQLQKQFAISLFFIPSVVFWGSGLLKDTITISAVGWYTYYFYSFFILKKYKFSSISYVLIASFLLIAIKPYIFFALLPGSLIWLSNERLAKIQSKVLRFMAGPFFLCIGLGLSFLLLSQMGDFLGLYRIDTVLDRAVVVNLDQKQEYYGGNSFDIGEFDANIGSMLGKAHLAIAATLFRPYLWDARNPVMLLSAIENTYILLLTIFLLIKLKFFGFFKFIGKNPLLLFSILFSLFFAFSVGIATSNFGSLVRLKIPCIPFYVSSLFVLKYFYEKQSNKKLRF